MPMIHPVCCGIDVHAAQLTACRRQVSDEGQITTELVEWGTTYRELIALHTWMQALPCPMVAMESTGVSWKPVYHVLREAVAVWVAQSQEVRPRPGTKTDKREAIWMAELLAHGLIKPSFVPPPEMRALRDLTRTRVSLVQSARKPRGESPRFGKTPTANWRAARVCRTGWVPGQTGP